MASANFVDYVVIALYALLMVRVGFYVLRFNRGAAEYFRGGNRIPWLVGGLSCFMAGFSAWTFTGAAGVAYRSGIAAIGLYIGNALSFLLGYFIFAKRWRRSRITAVMEYLSGRFNPATHQVFSWTTIVFQLFTSASTLFGLSLFVSSACGFPVTWTILGAGALIVFYCVLGGLWAVVVTDFLQASILMPFCMVLVIMSLARVGGASGLVHSLPPATSEQGIYVSNDGGVNWRKSELPGAGAKVRAIATSLHHPETAYVSYDHLMADKESWMGVAKTTNSGADWKLVWRESAVAAKNVKDAWITERFGPGWGENPLNLTVAQQDANLAYSTDLGRTMRTTDRGATWAAVYSRKVNDVGWASLGLDVTTSYGIHFDPFDPKRQFITYTDIGLFRSEDGGVSWASSTAGVPRDWMNTTYWVVFDPKVRGRMWSVNSWTHDLPRPKMWRHNSVLTYKGGVCRSDDGGKHWIQSNAGMDETGATHILLDPTSPVDARVLYIAGFGRGFYKSSDGGRSWALKNNGITQGQPFAWRLARSSNGSLYAVIARRSENGSIGNSDDGALYRSTDGAEHWLHVSLPEGTNGPNGLAIDPESPDRLYLAAWARATGEHGDGGGIFLSEDGGKSWKQVLDKDRHIYDVTIDPRDPNVIYAAGFESSAWRSADRGLHWTRISGFNFKWGNRVVPDPLNPNEVYVTTFGGSVWHGAIDGQQRGGDIATPVLDPAQ